ncbi:MAG: hypothetical protein OEY11_14050 [Gammaproteobacteria bacterium]|nr:hypothetical protein [Gammaproteobacteria bacterium]
MDIKICHRNVIMLLLVFVSLMANSFYLQAAENPAIWKHKVKGNFATVLADIKTGLESSQFMITGEENLSKGLENNKQVFGVDKWNTIGFDNVTAVHFCSMVFNQEVFNINMDWSILCPFKVVAYSMKAVPNQVTIITARPSYLLRKDRHKKARQIGNRMDKRIIDAIMSGVSP